MTIRAVRIRGPFRGPTGYDHHVREFVRHLVLAGVSVQLEEMPSWSLRRLPKPLQDPWFQTLHEENGARVFLQFCMPHQMTPSGGFVPVNYTMFETSRVPRNWARSSRATLTIVPEESSRRAWLAAGMPEDQLRTCPLGIDPVLFSPDTEPLDIRDNQGRSVTERRVRFLNISEIGPRKNQKGLLRAWLRGTGLRDDTVLILKLGGHFKEDHASVDATMSELESEEAKRFAIAAPVVFFNEILSDADMPRLYAAATHYLSMSHGEGWDLPMMEAAATGLQLIAPDHTAYRTYLDPNVATLIPSVPEPAVATGHLGTLFDGSSWWEPDCDAAVAAIRRAIDGLDTPVASARDFVLGHWTWTHATERLIEILTEAETMQPA